MLKNLISVQKFINKKTKVDDLFGVKNVIFKDKIQFSNGPNVSLVGIKSIYHCLS